jgi:CheY-specific phosphatase CheX
MCEPSANAVLPPEVIEAFTLSAISAVREQMQLEAFPAGASTGAAVLAGDSIVAAMRLQRTIPGTLTLVLPRMTAQQLAEAYLPAGTELTDEIIRDVAGELANVIGGQAKTILKESPYHFALSIPTVSCIAQCKEIYGVPIAITLETGQVDLYINISPSPVE